MDMSAYQTGRYHTGDQWVAVLYREGRTRLHVVFRDDSGVRHATAPREHARSIRPLQHNGSTYPVSRMVKRLRAIGKASSITATARAELVAAGAAKEAP